MLKEKIEIVRQHLQQVARELEFCVEMTSDCRSLSAPRREERLRYRSLADICRKTATEIALSSSAVLYFDEADATEEEIGQHGKRLASLINGLSLARFTASLLDKWSLGKLKSRQYLACPRWSIYLGDIRDAIDSIRELGGLSDPRISIIITDSLGPSQLAVYKWPDRTPYPLITGRSAEVATLLLCLE